MVSWEKKELSPSGKLEKKGTLMIWENTRKGRKTKENEGGKTILSEEGESGIWEKAFFFPFRPISNA